MPFTKKIKNSENRNATEMHLRFNEMVLPHDLASIFCAYADLRFQRCDRCLIFYLCNGNLCYDCLSLTCSRCAKGFCSDCAVVCSICKYEILACDCSLKYCVTCSVFLCDSRKCAATNRGVLECKRCSNMFQNKKMTF